MDFEGIIDFVCIEFIEERGYVLLFCLSFIVVFVKVNM